MDFNEMWDYLIENVGVSEETLQIVCAIDGSSPNTLEAVLYATTGYRDFDQLEDEDED